MVAKACGSLGRDGGDEARLMNFKHNSGGLNGTSGTCCLSLTKFTSDHGSIGKHYAGPTWESNDGSKVVGEVKAKDAGPNASAIPWLLLSAKSTTGDGVFSHTQSIQRLHTVGGKAPADGCNQTLLGKETRVPYKATYFFYVAKP